MESDDSSNDETSRKRIKRPYYKKKNSERKGETTGETKFREAQKKLQELVQKHLEDHNVSSSGEEEELETKNIFGSVIKNYSDVGGKTEDLERTQNFLENVFHSGTAVCLICIATVKRNDQIWSCSSCFGFFHLLCIQRWAKDSIAHQKLPGVDVPGPKNYNFQWQCPKCRSNYGQALVPYNYFCFCGQKSNPEFHPWLVPHSCGDVCNKSLSPACGHHCLLLCHPGPCPPCPKIVCTSCYCEKGEKKAMRCSEKVWSCGSVCGKLLQCNQHPCLELCHAGPCPPCDEKLEVSCDCGAETSLRLCSQLEWHCNKICGKSLDCGKHVCQRICHKEECGSCPNSLSRYCPCGKKLMVIPCDTDVMTCGETCGKPCDTGNHSCSERCHKGPCPPCLEMVMKTCHCGLRQKEIACHKVYLCDAKCKKMRDCYIHPCNKKCCDGNCPPCERLCGKTLSCGNHKCSSMCHRGSCFPCGINKKISCKCGETAIKVPCGAARRTSPPRCNKPCTNPPKCDHPTREEHKCHFGDCPPCQLICGKPKECGHSCPEKCHTALYLPKEDYKPATPWDVVNTPYELKRLPCSKCEFIVDVRCFGEHEVLKLPCYRAQAQSCGQQCGRQLSCTNHVCTLDCHVVENAPSSIASGSNCEECSLDCNVERECGHPCPLPCHPGDCDPCKAILKTRCHCNLVQFFFDCNNWTSTEDKSVLLSCGNRCPKNYECGHRCIEKCHSGECPRTVPCRKKVKVTCACQRIKKEQPCHLSGQLSCDDVCLQLKADKLKREETEREKRRIAEEKKNKEELLKYEKRMQGGKRRERKRNVDADEKSWLATNYTIITGVSVCIIVLGIAAYFIVSK